MRWLARITNALGRSRWFTAVMSRILTPFDRFVKRVTGGRTTFTELVFPTLVLTHVGRRSGREYQTPLMFVRDDDGVPVVVGTNFGQRDHPAWSANLLENPGTRIELDGRVIPVRAVPVTDEETRSRAWDRLDDMYSGYRFYRQRVDRDIRMFRLEPQEDQG